MRPAADPPGVPAPRGPTPVIALHCSGSSGRQWRALRARVADATFHAPDLVGSGASPAWAGERPFDLAEEAKPLLEILRVLGAPVHLVGHSYGGAVALHIALHDPACVASLALYEPSAFHVLQGGEAAARLAHREIAGVAAACVTGLMCGDYAAATERFVRYWGGEDAWARLVPDARGQMVASLPTFVLHFRALLGEPTRLSDFAGLRLPVLLLRGDRSPSPARHVTDSLTWTIPGADRRVLAGADHMAPLSRAEEVAAVIAAFQQAAEARCPARPGRAA